MYGGIVLGRAVSENRIGFCDLKVEAKRSFFSGRERAGAGILFFFFPSSLTFESAGLVRGFRSGNAVRGYAVGGVVEW